MIRFMVFDPSASAPGPARAWSLRHAYLFGADDVPIPASLHFDEEAGCIVGEKSTLGSCGLCLQWAVDVPLSTDDLETVLRGEFRPGSGKAGGGGIGVLTIQTCLLPERARPYLLSLELARHRLMLVINKLEDWSLFDLPPTDPGIVLFERARRVFTHAVVAGGYTAEADRLARQSLALAMDAGEALAITQARVQFSKRMSGELAQAAARIAAPSSALTDHEVAESRNALLGTVGVILPTPPQFGCVVSPEQCLPAHQKAAAASCDFLVMPMRWVDMEPTEGKYLFAKTDRWIEWAVRTARMPLVGGPLIDFRHGCVPEWLYIWEHDYETLRELVYEHVKNLVTRYRRTVGTWTVASGLNVSSNFTLTLEQVVDLTRLAVMIVRKLQPSAKVQIQIDQPWGEYYARTSARAMPPITYAEVVLQQGINPDLFALRLEMGQPDVGRSTRDLMAISAMLDKFAALERPLSLAAVSGPSQPAADDDLGLDGEHEPGYLRSPWSKESQVHWMTQVLSIASSKPFVHSVAWHELYDAGLPQGAAGTAGAGSPSVRAIDHMWSGRHDGLFDSAGQHKPAMLRLAEIRSAVKARVSPATLPMMPVISPANVV
jgi:Glycosyl hydrolase family 10